jgi:pyrimidine-nucleoside phosphorylase
MPKHARALLNPVELIVKKRDGGVHDATEIHRWIEAYVAGDVADYQMSAWLMAALLRGLEHDETVALTHAMLESGRRLTLPSIERPKIDKHSTGGVGDKVSLCLGPAVAACGVAVPMMAGRALGHTGGTLDKLEAIPGYRVNLSVKEFEKTVREVGVAIIGQTAELAPADRRLYALRDVTGTVESIPLIVASILSKKLAEGADAFVFDVKAGRGAFMKDPRSAAALAKQLVRVAATGGKRATALVTDMSQPTGATIGNALETREAIAVLRDEGPADTRELTLLLGAEMLLLARMERTRGAARRRIEQALASGRAFETFCRMVQAQGGDVRAVEDPRRLPRAKQRIPLLAERAGFVTALDALELGLCAVLLGAGRTRAGQALDLGAGIELAVRRGDRVEARQALAWVHVRAKSVFEIAAPRLRAAFTIRRTAPRDTPLLITRVSGAPR